MDRSEGSRAAAERAALSREFPNWQVAYTGGVRPYWWATRGEVRVEAMTAVRLRERLRDADRSSEPPGGR